jgi:hypothetical protein
MSQRRKVAWTSLFNAITGSAAGGCKRLAVKMATEAFSTQRQALGTNCEDFISVVQMEKQSQQSQFQT